MSRAVHTVQGLRRRWLVAGVVVSVLLMAPAMAMAIEINQEFKPQEEFKLNAWVPLEIGPVNMQIDKAVFLLVLSGLLTCLTMIFIANRLKAQPNKTQMAVELLYDVARNQITRDNIDRERYAQKWFPFLAALFFFILFNNFLGFVPLPVDDKHEVNVLGVEVNALALYAATANFSVPLILTVVVWIAYNVEGIREKGFFSYLGGLVPDVPGPAKPPLFVLEIISHLVRLISLSARLFANMLAGHMLILLMGGGLAILLINVFVGVLTAPIAVAFYIFEVLIVAGLQAFIFAILSGIYIGEAVALEGH